MWLTRLKLLTRPNRPSAVALMIVGVTVLFVGGGLAVTQQLQEPQRTASVLVATTTSDLPSPSETTSAPTVEGVAPSVPTTPTSSTPASGSGPSTPVAPGATTPPQVRRPSDPPAPPPVQTPSPGVGRPPIPAPVTPPTPAPTAPLIAANGPLPPSVSVAPDPGRFRPEDPEVSIMARVADPDGYVNRIDIDWNDGSEPTVIEYPLSSCVIPSSSTSVSQAHTFQTPGTYSVTVTVTSVSCNGAASQQAIDVLEVNAAGPSVGAQL